MKKFTLLLLMIFCGMSMQSQNLLSNGDFEGGATDWFGNAFNIQCDGGNCFNLADVATAGNAFDVNLSQGLEIVQGETYILTFDASTDPTTAARTMIVGIGLNEAPFDADIETANLTDVTQSFEFTFTATFGLANSRVLFDMGAETGVVVIDNVSLVLDDGSGGNMPTEAAPVPPARDPNAVFSIYSDAYTNQPNVVFGAFNVGTLDITEGEIGGDNHQEIVFTQPDPQFLLVDWGTIVDNTAMTHFHMDYWIDTSLDAGLIANPLWSNHVGDAGETSSFGLTNPVTTFGQWVSIDVPLTDFDFGNNSNNQQRDALRQFVLTVAGADNGARTLFLDNVYLHNDTTLSTDDFNTLSINAFPNPVVNTWNLETIENITEVSVYNVLGERVLQASPNNTTATLDLSNLSAGLYIANVTSGAKSTTLKLIKK